MIVFDAASPVPAFEQIREQVAGLIRVGGLTPGHRLPPIRQLAADLGIAPGTVARAFTELEAAGLIRTSRRGAHVADGQAVAADLGAPARRFAADARRAGASLEDAVATLRATWSAVPAD